MAAVRSAAGGQAVFGAALAKRLKGWFEPTRPRHAPPFPELTDRERDILDGVAAGLGNTEIGARLYLSPKTVANNITTILAKLHLAHRTDAIITAREAGLGQSRSTTP